MIFKIACTNIVFSLILSIAECVKTSVNLELLADWGGYSFFPYKSFVELAVGREMAYIASKLDVDAILALGDNFYWNGVTDVKDLRFNETFETAFDYDSLNVPWFIIAGNHDHYGNVSAQVAYTKVSNRWCFPDLYYTKQLNVPFTNMTVDLVMTDTVILCGNTDPEDPYKQPSLDSVPYKMRETHWEWLENTLKLSRANYLLVCGHYPVYSIASHGPTKCLVNRLEPLLKKYGVTAYFNGHDHNLQHIQVEEGDLKMDYFVVGSANFIDPSKKHLNDIPPGSLKFHWGNPFSLGAFAFLSVNKSAMNVSFIQSNGNIMYSTVKSPRYY